MLYTKFLKTTYKHNDKKCLVVFIHGILEAPVQFNFLTKETIKNNYSYLNILLPGHCKTSKDFYQNGYKEWTRYIENQIKDLEDVYENIILVGHSMGCLLAINYYLKNKEKIKGIFCLALPLNIWVDFKMFLACLKIIVIPKAKKFAFEKDLVQESSISNNSFLRYILWLPRYIDLFYLSYKIRFNIKNIKVPTVYLQSFYDNLVSIRSVETLKKILSKKYYGKSLIIILKSSNHFKYSQNDKEIIVQNFNKFLKMAIN